MGLLERIASSLAVGLVVTGVGFIYWPLAFIALGALILVAVIR